MSCNNNKLNSRQYGYIYNQGAQTIAVDAPVLFSTNGVMTDGIKHVLGTGDITVFKGGDYRVDFYTEATAPNEFTLFLNNEVVSGATYGSADATPENPGRVIVALEYGDTLSLKNYISAAAITLPAIAGGTQSIVNASILIEKLS